MNSVDTTSGNDSLAERIFNFSDDGSSRFSLGREDGGLAVAYNDGNFTVTPTSYSITSGRTFQTTSSLNIVDTGTDAYEIFVNGGSVLSESGLDLSTAGLDRFTIGSSNSSGERSLQGKIQEVLLFDSVLGSSDRGTIESSQFAFYNIPEPSALILTFVGALGFFRRRRV